MVAAIIKKIVQTVGLLLARGRSLDVGTRPDQWLESCAAQPYVAFFMERFSSASNIGEVASRPRDLIDERSKRAGERSTEQSDPACCAIHREPAPPRARSARTLACRFTLA
jgi:hypothetical protein